MNLNDEVQYRRAVPADYQLIYELVTEIWGEVIPEYQRFHEMLNNSDRTFVAVENERIVGFARALCDDVSVGYITMVGVAADCRGKGIGGRIVKMITGDDHRIKWVLTSGVNPGFWKRLGFTHSTSLMVKSRRDDSCHQNNNCLTGKNSEEIGIMSRLKRTLRSLLSS